MRVMMDRQELMSLTSRLIVSDMVNSVPWRGTCGWQVCDHGPPRSDSKPPEVCLWRRVRSEGRHITFKVVEKKLSSSIIPVGCSLLHIYNADCRPE